MTLKPSSAKAKGRKLQNEIAAAILAEFPELEPDDVRGAVMGESGEDVKLSPAARKLLNVSIEAKNQERISIWKALAQAEANARPGSTPVVIFRRNRSKTYMVVEFHPAHLLAL